MQRTAAERRAQQLFGEQRIAFGEVFDLRQHFGRHRSRARLQRVLQEVPHFVARQSAKFDAARPGTRRDAAQRSEPRIGHRAIGAKRHDERYGRRAQMPQKVRGQFQRAGVGPMQIFDDAQERFAGRFTRERRRHAFEQRILCVAGVFAPWQPSAAACAPLQAGQQGPERQIRRVDVLFALSQRHGDAVRMPLGKLRDQARFADARIAFERHEADASVAGQQQLFVEKRQLFPTADEPLAIHRVSDHVRQSATPTRNPVMGANRPARDSCNLVPAMKPATFSEHTR